MEIKSSSTLRRGGGRRTTRSVNPMAAYDCALRCAIRAYIEQNGNQPAVKEKKERQSVHIGVGDVFGSLTEKFGEESKPDKLTKEIVRGLLRRLEDINKGKDTSKAEFQDKRFIAVVGQAKKVLQQHRYKPTGTVNDLVIIFLKASEVELKKSNPNPAVWYAELNNYIARFAELVMLTVQEDAPSSATPELLEKLNGFIHPSKPGRRNSDKAASPSASPSPSGSIDALENFGMCKTVQNLFRVEDSEHRRKLRELQPICTESAFLLDLKKCINNVHTNQPFPGRREDFPTPQVYDNWQKREVKQLTELMKTLMLMNPNLSLAATSKTDVGSSNLLSGGKQGASGAASPTPSASPSRQNSVEGGNRSSVSDSSDVSSASPFTYVPNDPRSYFRLLMNMCIDYDNNVTPDVERAKTSVLSQQSDELLRECWKTWRLSSPFRAVLYLELVKSRFDAEELDVEDVKDATRALDKVIKENDVATWAINDRESLIRAFEGLNQTLLHALADALSEYWKISPEWVSDLVGMLDKIYENPAFLEDHPDPLQEFARLEETVEGAAVERWRYIEKASNNPENDALTNLMTMAEKLQKELVSLSKRKFKTPIKDILSVPGIVMARQMPYFALEIDNWAYSPEAQTASIEVTFELYHKLLSVKRLYDQHGPKKKTVLFKVESWFLQHVRRWLQTTSAATLEWVENAIKQDEFTSINETAMHSSSIVDLFSMLHQAIDFVQNLQWPNELQRCRFITALSKVIGIAVEQYTYLLEDMITNDISPKVEGETEGAASASFLDRARYQLYGGRTNTVQDVTPSDFQSELCVKINDIEAARGRLDRLYQIMDVDEIADIMREYGTPTVEKTEQTNYMYSIKVVRAENLQALDNNGLSDPYAVLEIDQKQILRTRTVYETLNPRWDQTCDIWLSEEAVDVLAVVYDEDMIGANEECGLVWFKLSPEYFDDYQTHELVLNLHPQGKIVLRVSMEGEKDDVQFWFGKTFRTLKRAENDAAGLVVDKMGGFMRQCLTRKTLDKLLGRERGFFSGFNRANRQVEPSLQDCEDAIAPLLDYLEKNLKVLNDNLSETTMRLVVLKVWKAILFTLEGIMLPPLSEHPSDLKPLDEYETHVVFKWLELLKILFNGGEDGDGVPLDRLESSQYHALLAINAAYNIETDKLMENYHTVLKSQAEMKMRGGRKADRSKTMYHSKHTMKRNKSGRKSVALDMPSSETILRILRMRPGKEVKEFLHTEFQKRNHPPSSPTAPANAIAATEMEHQLAEDQDPSQ
ncbi:hypothetical protein DFQ28_011189 [Apophysomyces sp. BC1034]|nr:hypothetical protein DFQ30_010929 [Apophysomyces sp. BC1015]KAG0180504.1 hypothetical protein DFQ29_000546 [Apophysomyces sp. BC1021]KAG0184412.1 hypothetical protein DFQ28_011189 [Apophysomyces sp. BC1034]